MSVGPSSKVNAISLLLLPICEISTSDTSHKSSWFSCGEEDCGEEDDDAAELPGEAVDDEEEPLWFSFAQAVCSKNIAESATDKR